MLTLILMRHAQAESFSGGSDHERALTRMGEEQAAASGRLIAQWGFAPQVVIASDATRAMQTAKVVTREICFPFDKVAAVPELYSSYTTSELIDIIANVANKKGGGEASQVLLIAHNPDLSYRSDALMNEALPVGFPTAGVLALYFDCDAWSDVSARSASLLRTSFF